MASVPDTSKPIPAATILLVKDDPSLKVLMVERHADISFAGGALVFPGGKVDVHDEPASWCDHTTGLSDDPVLAASQIAVIREAFEEVGVLLARPVGADRMLSDEELAPSQALRGEIEQDPSRFNKLCRQNGWRLAADLLTPYAHWIAPPGLHKRFDTRFFVAKAVSQSVKPDGNEATEAKWVCPTEVMQDAREGRQKVIFPTARNLELLALAPNAEGTISNAKARCIEQICPQIIERNGERFLTIPEGLGYPVTEERLESVRRQ